MDEDLNDDTVRHASDRDRKIQHRRVVVAGRSTSLLWRQGIEPAREIVFQPTPLIGGAVGASRLIHGAAFSPHMRAGRRMGTKTHTTEVPI